MVEEGHRQSRAVLKYWAPPGAVCVLAQKRGYTLGAVDPNFRDLDLIHTSKSGYFGRSPAPNARDLDIIRRLAVVNAKTCVSGVVGPDEDNGSEMSVLSGLDDA